MLGETFTGAQLATEVNRKISKDGFVVGSTAMDSEGKLGTVVESGELIPFRAFKIIQYTGNASEKTSNWQTQFIDVGFTPSMVVVIGSIPCQDAYGDPYAYDYTIAAIATSTVPFKCEEGVLMQIEDSGFTVGTFRKVTSGDLHYVGLNHSGGAYTALVFP